MIKVIQKKAGAARLIALLTAAIVIMTACLINVSATLAAANDIVVRLECESGISEARTVEAGQTKPLTAFSLNQAYSSKPAIAKIDYTPGSGINNIEVTGVEAGVASVSYSTKTGILSVLLYQVTDNGNVSAYTIRDGGEAYFSEPGVTKASPVGVTAGNRDRIEWRSTNTGVATVDESGDITATGLGAAIVIGSFTDKWGVDRDLHVLVGVGVVLSDSDLGRLLELIKEGERVLADEADNYTVDSLEALVGAVAGGKEALDGSGSSEQEILDAIGALESALGGLESKPVLPPGVIGPDVNGNYYKPVGDPANIFEVVDGNGDSLDPQEYVYSESGDPVGECEDNRPADKEDGMYYVEDPEGSNIYKKVEGEGGLKDSPAVWGGPDGAFGTADDEEVSMFEDGTYWVHVGQNVWQEVTGPYELGELTGGGPDESPVTSPAQPVVLVDGKYYIGPLGPKDDPYYYGDKLVGGDGLLNSTAGELHGTDEKYYLVGGKMTNKRPITEGKPANGNILSAKDAGDSSDWVEIARNGDYSLIVRKDYINIKGSNYGNPLFQCDIYTGGKYVGSSVQSAINKWFTGVGIEAGADKLSKDARLRDFTVENNAIGEIGSGPGANGFGSGLSKPTHTHNGKDSNVAFALSYGEAANYVSKSYKGADNEDKPSSSAAAANFGKVNLLKGNKLHDSLWLRSPGTSSGTMSALGFDGRVYQRLTGGANGEAAMVHPALWVETAIFDK